MGEGRARMRPEPGGALARARRRLAGAALLSPSLGTIALAPARAAELSSLGLRLGGDLPISYPEHEAALSLGLFGLVVFAATTAIIHVRGRRVWVERDRAQKAAIAELRFEKERADLILASEPQVLVSWVGKDSEPDIIGDPQHVLGLGVGRRLLGFGSWLPPKQARALETAVDSLKARGERFSMVAETTAGRFVSIDGSPFSGRALMRLREVSADRQMRTQFESALRRLERETQTLRALLDAIPQPLWLRDSEGRLSWVNAAYARAVEAVDAAAAVRKGSELLDQKVRDEAGRVRAAGASLQTRTATVVSGAKVVFDVVDVATGAGSGGIAIDVTELEAARADVAKEIESHVRTLHQLPTAVAIFDRGKRLQFHNEAYRTLWQLDPAFLAGKPSDGEILDLLRAERRLPEQADFRGWKRTMLEGYQTLDTLEHWWYLPDGRTLRVVTNPNPQGGVTYLFDDVTERFHLESRFNALSRVQGETLDTLKEGVAVFGSDGRLKLCNPAFCRLWGLDPLALQGEPHIDTVIKGSGPAFSAIPVWTEIRTVVTSVQDARQPIHRRFERTDGTVLDCATSPLPDGATLVTFSDVSAGVQAERMLKERNEALETATQIKNTFVQTVSYELRTPLQNITGFAEALASGTAGPLNPQQHDYLSHITASSETLKALVEDILDLANIDTGNVELNFEAVDIRSSIEAAIAGLRDRIETSGVRIGVSVTPHAGRFLADGKRVRQILFNLLKNAIGYSEPGQKVLIKAFNESGQLVLQVIDQGRGIPREIVEKVFERFEAHTIAGHNKGAGLGLAIVRSFVELHGGTVRLESVEGQGTTVTCRFPLSVGEPVQTVA